MSRHAHTCGAQIRIARQCDRPGAVTGTRRQPSHTEAGTVVWQPAKLTAKASAIHVAYLVIDLCPFAQHVD